MGCTLKGVEISNKNNGSYAVKYQAHILCSFDYKVVCVDNKFSKKLFYTEEKVLFIGSLKQFLKSMIILKKMIKKHFNKNLIMSAKDEERFQLSSNCWICDKFFDVRDDNVRDHCHITGKYRGHTGVVILILN